MIQHLLNLDTWYAWALWFIFVFNVLFFTACMIRWSEKRYDEGDFKEKE